MKLETILERFEEQRLNHPTVEKSMNVVSIGEDGEEFGVAKGRNQNMDHAVLLIFDLEGRHAFGFSPEDARLLADALIECAEEAEEADRNVVEN